MGTLSARDARSVLGYVTDLLSVEDYHQVPPVMLEGLARLVDADAAALTHLDVVSQHQVAVFWPAPGPQLDLLAGYAQVAASHPLRPPLLTLSGTGTGRGLACPRAGVGPAPAPLCVSDLLGARAWRETPIQREVLRGITDQMWLPLAVRGRTVHAVTLDRGHGTFTDRQRDVLQACGRHLRAAANRARRTPRVGLQLVPRLEWVSLSSAPGVTAARPPATPHRGGVPDHDGGEADRTRLPLSARELQVLALVAEGLTDGQISRQLDIRPATVSKHLHRVYTRHGITNRAAAVQLWTRQTTPPR